MAPKIKLIYFNAKGRAELARLVLAEAGVDYEDQRLTFEEFGKIKECKLTRSMHWLID